jgi:hydrophobe/amphiphile efflux-3 (HAE3) family protein
MIMRRLLQKQLKYSKLIVGFFIILLAVAITYLPDFKVDPSLSALVGDNSQFNTNDRILSNTYESNSVFSVIMELEDSSTLENRVRNLEDDRVTEYSKQIAEIMEQSQYVNGVSNLQINNQGTYARLNIFTTVPRSTGGFQEVIDDLNSYLDQSGSLAGVETTLSGFSILLTRINLFLITDNVKAIGFTAVALFFLLLWYFKTLRFTLITLSIPIISLILLAAVMAFLEIPLTITLAAVGVLMLGLGIDYAIHVTLAYQDSCSTAKNKKMAIVEALDHLNKAILASYITTLAGFAALTFGISPSSQGQGLVLSLGITIIYLTTIILLPSLIYLFGGLTCPVESEIVKKVKQGLLKLAKIQTKKPKLVLIVIGVITVLMFFGASNVSFSTSNNNWVPDGDPVAESFRKQSLAFGSDFSSLTVVVQSTRDDLRNVQTVRDIQKITRLLEGLEEVISVESPFKDLPLEKSEIIKRTSNELKSDFNKDYTLSTIDIRVTDFGESDSGDSGLREEIFELFEENPIYFADISYYGDTVRFSEVGESLQRDTFTTTLIALSLVFILASLTYASPIVGLIALLPVIIGVLWTVGFMGLLNVPFTSLSSGLIALVLGAGVDFSIHLVNSTFNSIKKGKDLFHALEHTIAHTGTPILLSSATTFLGFLSLLLATLLGVQRLGMSLALSILSVFLVTIVMVPAILAVTNKKYLKKEAEEIGEV